MATDAEYNPAAYQALTVLSRAFEKYEDRKAETGLAKLGKLLIEHDVYHELAIILLHRHFDMNEAERLVEFGPVSVPWSYRAGHNKLIGGTVKPRSWMFHNGRLTPYEFGYNEALGTPAYPDLPDKPRFFEEFGQILESEGLSDILGLTLVGQRPDGTVGMERTFNRSNVMFNMPLADFEKEKSIRDFIPAMWEVTPADSNRQGSFVGGPQEGWYFMACKCWCYDDKHTKNDQKDVDVD